MQNAEDDRGSVAFSTPILKLTQSMTTEVKRGDAEPGEFYNSLTGESYGTKVDFIVSFFQYGRSASDKKTGRYYVAIGTDTIPESWADLVGEEFVGTRFDEHPDAEEQYKIRVNGGEIPWGSGPLISTTYNYTGLVFPPALEGEEDPDPMPVRISFLRSTKKASDNLQSLRRALLRNKPWFDVVFELSTESKTFNRNESFVVNVKKSRPSTTEERKFAFEVAQAVVAGRTQSNDEQAADKPAEPDSNGGLGV